MEKDFTNKLRSLMQAFLEWEIGRGVETPTFVDFTYWLGNRANELTSME